MDTANMIINVIAILTGLGIYMAVMNSPWGKKHQEFMYAIMLGAILIAVLIGGFVRWLVIIR